MAKRYGAEIHLLRAVEKNRLVRMERNTQRIQYHNRKTTLPTGKTFDSQREALRYNELTVLAKAGYIADLKRQVKFTLIPKQRLKSGKALRECAYVADFTYTDTRTGEHIVEDVKGHRTPEYIIKKKLMLHLYGIEVTET